MLGYCLFFVILGVFTGMARRNRSSKYDMQKYVVIYEDERVDKKHPHLPYKTWGHTFTRKKDDALNRAKQKSNGVVVRAFICDWRDLDSQPVQILGIVIGDFVPAVVSGLLMQIREENNIIPKINVVKPRVRTKSTEQLALPAPKKVKHYRPPYTLKAAK